MAQRDVRGTYGIAVVCSDEPDVIVAARKGSPLILGVGQNEYLVASDAAAIVEHTNRVIYLSDGEIVRITPGGYRTTTLDAVPVTKQTSEIEWSLERGVSTSLGGIIGSS